MEAMDAKSWITAATRKLDKAGIGTARLDALVLLEDVTGKDRGWLLAHPEHRLLTAEQAELTKLLKRRAGHTPLAYVRGHTEFYGYSFVITPSVLEPRPESETMIDLLLQLETEGLFGPRKGTGTLRIADVGTGSGALGIVARLMLGKHRKVSVDLLELDAKALTVAETNVEKHTTNISVIQSDLLTESPKDYEILLCNLPYVPDSFTVNEAAQQEPKLAIFGGADGLDVYRALFKQVAKLKKQPLYILTEALPPQHHGLADVAAQTGYKIDRTDDFIQVFVRAPQD
jgi:release factor glutamine methyltransferase